MTCLLGRFSHTALGFLLVILYGKASSAHPFNTLVGIPEDPHVVPIVWNGTAHQLSGSNMASTEDEPAELSVGTLLGALAVAFVGAAMANAAGVGGGAVFVPIFNLVLGQDLKHATAMSQVMVTAGALVGVLLNLHKRNPVDPGRTLIQVDFVLLLLPAILLGISVGVLFNVALQVWLQKFLMVTLYIYLAIITLKKGCQLLGKELEARRCQKELLATEGYESSHPSEVSHAEDVANDLVEQGEQQLGVTWVAMDGIAVADRQKWMSRASLAALVALWAVYFSFSLMHHTRPFCIRCSTPFWALYAAMAATTLVITVAILRHVSRKNSPRAAAGDESGLQASLIREDFTPLFETHSSGGLEEGIDWSEGNLIKCTVVMAMAGVTAGFMGIGGGMIMSPLLLTLNVHPQVTAATSSMMVLFSSSAAFVQLALEGMIDPWSALSFGTLAMVASATGVLLVRRFIQRYGTTSVIVLVLGAFIAIAAVVIMVSGIMEFEIVDRSYMQLFINICSGSADEVAAASCLN
mmetsp:Transcript_26995/g.76077  ORF Transcript_26995/g.76077 Transcript_26995/m.76077 type:complete len:523 (-) Transcript_26995:604-2172(-)|eukprot:CAMPEP_0117662598 /NCGR_PEP_ID=MMETSP0804-20121206/8136_1 /TAXON_ID=1074897 /ORGANISM="Tetraselmis astigmatica, Strain CCMP880" /LENGTH=522 /DNA_ID=CAMNT_0005469503 /DNA_START=204 /DNA_END=1772 /DNA_ORIENTATION=-